MSRSSEPSRPIDAYMAIIDQLVDETRRYGPSYNVGKSGIFSKAPAHAPYNEFIATLTDDQRERLAKMLFDARDGAVGDVLALLSWWIDCRQLGLTYRGEPMSVGLSGMGLHGDYIGRCADWEWPSEHDVNGAHDRE